MSANKKYDWRIMHKNTAAYVKLDDALTYKR